MTAHKVPAAGTIGSALTPPARFSGAEYGKALALMPAGELLAEYEAVCAAFYSGETRDAACERVRLSRREMARRLSLL